MAERLPPSPDSVSPTPIGVDDADAEAPANEIISDVDTAAAAPAGNSQHRAAKRVLELIEIVAASDRPLSLSELARRADLPKSTTHSLVHTLASEGFLERASDGGHYSLGGRLLRLLIQLPQRFELSRVARPVMQRLVDEIGETSLIGVRRGDKILYVEQVEAPQFIRYVAPLGELRPLYCTSIGKLFMANMPASELRTLLRDHPPHSFTTYTKTNIGENLAEARAVKERGYGLNREESVSGVTAIAAPIHQAGDPEAPLIAGLALVGPSDRMGPKLEQARELVLDAGTQIALAVRSR